MIPETYRKLIDKLAERTQSGRVNWHPTADESEFVVYFDDFSLAVRFHNPEHDPDYYYFTLRDNTGRSIDSFWIEFGEDDFEHAAELFSAARRKALRIDQALKVIIRELEQAESVGHAKAPLAQKPADDDIPF